MTSKFTVLALDLHNTIYDEVMEYGMAIEAAAESLPVNRSELYEELSDAHARVGSDWDDGAWMMLPCLKNLPNKEILNAIRLRQKKSKELVISGVYDGAVETLKALKEKNIRIYLITEAVADVAMKAVSWLGLGGVIDGVYSYPSGYAADSIKNTYHKVFASDGDSHIKKPNPQVILNVAKDHAEHAGISVEETLSQMLYVGDSKYKDGTMAQKAGVKFGWAAYGKKLKPGQEKKFLHARKIMYAVTGWDKQVLKLTQEAAHDEKVDKLKPDYSFENSLSEALPLF